MIILGLYIAITIAMIILAIWAAGALTSAPGGIHSKPDAPTLGDVLAAWLREHVRGCIAVVADDIAHRHPWRSLQIRLWTRQLRRDTRLRVPAAASAPGEGTAPGKAGTGAVPLEVRVTASDGHPAVGFRAGKPPWTTAGQPELTEYLP